MSRKRPVSKIVCDGCGVVGHKWKNCPVPQAIHEGINASRSAAETSRDGPENQEECAECGQVGHLVAHCPLRLIKMVNSALAARERRQRHMRLNQSGSKKPRANQPGTDKPRAQHSGAGVQKHGAAKRSAPSKQSDARQAAPKEPASHNQGSNHGIGVQSADIRKPVRRTSW